VADARAWREAGYDLGVAVNLSARSFEQDGLPDLVRATLAAHELEPQALTLEVTEKAVFDEPTRIESILKELAQIGVAISIDDFGTGHASLSRLYRFPISEVKIDRSFVGRITADERPFVDSIAKLVDALGIEVVAEGVEDIATLELLAKTPCRAAQGFFFCRPLPLGEFMEWLAKPHAGDIAHLEKLGIDHETAGVTQLVESARRASGGEVAWLAQFQGEEEVFAAISGDVGLFDQSEGDSRPSNDSYCARMVHGEIPNAIPDTRRHPLTRHLERANPNIGSYVGVPVRLPTGGLYGSLCSASRGARPISPETVRLLSVLAGLIGRRVPAGSVRTEGEVGSPDREMKS
jgi:GAF domain-containing protein